MAQVLKDEVRDSILESAREEFLEHGFEDSSMRRIAQKSKMTVGNLYRYFKSKDELSDVIVSPTYVLISRMVEKLTDGKLSLGKDGSGFSATVPEIKEMLASLSEGLVDIYKKHRVEVRILMMGSKLNKELTAWFAAVIADLISRRFPFGREDPRVKIMSACYSEAIFGGVKNILADTSLPEDSIKHMVNIYCNSYLMMLDQDFAALI